MGRIKWHLGQRDQPMTVQVFPLFPDGRGNGGEALSPAYAPDPALPGSPSGASPQLQPLQLSEDGLHSGSVFSQRLPSATYVKPYPPPCRWLVRFYTGLSPFKSQLPPPMDFLPSRPPLGEKEFCRPDNSSKGESLGIYVGGQCVREGDYGYKPSWSFLESPVSTSYREKEGQGEEPPSLSTLS